MDLTIEEIQMLLGAKDILIYQLRREIQDLTEHINVLTEQVAAALKQRGKDSEK